MFIFPSMARRLLIVLGLLALPAWLVTRPSPSDSQEDAGAAVVLMEPEISWTPAAPGEGRLFRLRATASEHTPVLGAHGSLGGEELHFERRSDRVFETLAAVPVAAGDTVQARLRFVYGTGQEERVTVAIPVTPGTYAHEELRVAPRFGSPLDSADQARLDRDRALAAEASRRAHRTPRIWSDSVVMPRSSPVTSGFGDGRIFNGRVSSRHMGLDLRGARGDTVVAAARGIVEVVEPFLLAGNVVYLNHGGGVLSGYFHLNRQLVQPGDTVEAGQPVGLVGATGRVTGPHLHWVVRYGTTSVDPRSLLEVAGR